MLQRIRTYLFLMYLDFEPGNGYRNIIDAFCIIVDVVTKLMCR